MYMDDDTLTPRDRISDDMLRRMLNGSGARLSETPAPERTPPCSNEGNSCIAGNTWGLKNHPLASVFAPLQEFRNVYDRDTAMKHGTIFAELNLPFMGATVNRGGCHHV